MEAARTEMSRPRSKSLAPLPITLDCELERFATAGAELMATRRLLRRSDTKFLLPESALTALLEQLRGDYALLCSGVFRAAEYRTLYFDTPDLRCFRDHLDGRRPRHKVRIRHYADRQVSFLEVKSKHQEVTVKHRARRRFGDDELADADLRFLASHCDLPVESLRPEIWTNFRRITLVGLIAPERVTVDVGVTAIRSEVVRDLAGVAVVEVKQPALSMQTPVMRALGAAGWRPVPASKYCIGLSRTRDDVPSYQVLSGLPGARAAARRGE